MIANTTLLMEAKEATKIYNNFFKRLTGRIFLPNKIKLKIKFFQIVQRRI